MANTPNAPALLPPPLLTPHAIPQVFGNTAQGSTWQQPQILTYPELRLPRKFLSDSNDDMQPTDFTKLSVDHKQLKVGDDDRYTLSAPHLPQWLRPEEVLQAVGELDNGNNGSTWSHIREHLKQKHQQPRSQPLSPDFNTVLRAMLSVLRHKGHLTIVTGGANNGLRHYTRRQAPAPDPIDTAGYLGYKLGLRPGGSLEDDSDSDGKTMDEEEEALMVNNHNAPSWFSPRMVLQEIERLFLRNWEKAGPGWTCQDIGDSLMQQNHKDLPLGFDFDATLRATLASLSKGGYLTTLGSIAQPCYTLSNPPLSFPTWFRPSAVLEAVGVLDGNNDFAGGSTWEDIKGHFTSIHDHSQPPWLDRLLETTLSVLHKRGYLTRGPSGPGYYTRRRHALATIDIPDDYVLCYYVGYELCRDLDHDVKAGDVVVDSPKRRGNASTSRLDEKQPLLTPDEDEAQRKEKSLHGLVTPSESTKLADKLGLRQRRPGEKLAQNEEKLAQNEWIIEKSQVAVTQTQEDDAAPVAATTLKRLGKPQVLQVPGIQASGPVTISQSSNGVSHPATPLNVTGGGGDQLAPRTQAEMYRKNRLWYMIWTLLLSFCGHALLYCLSYFVFGFGEDTPRLIEWAKNKWVKWAVMDLSAPVFVFILMNLLQLFYIDDLKDTSDEHAAKNNKIVSLAATSVSKFLYHLIKKLPVGHVKTLCAVAHVAAFLMDLGGALYVYWNEGIAEQVIPDLS